MAQTLELFELESAGREKPVNVSAVPLRSPFRYPGGKTWLVPLFRRWMMSLSSPPVTFVEPFAGGGIISLTVAFEHLAGSIVMVELDKQIADVWQTILGGEAQWLANRIVNFDLSSQSAKAEFAKSTELRRSRAFQTILKNRMAHGGILAEGAGVLKNGDNGKGIRSRWYPQTIAKRIREIEFVAKRIEFIHGDAFAVMARFQKQPDTVFFIDPPYTAGGKRAGSRLYTHSEIDHEQLFSLCKTVRGDFLMTYDNAEEVRALAKRYGFETRAVAMKNRHHAEMNELLIGRDLSWVADGGVFREEPTPYKVTPSKTKRGRRH